jgi:hypothetical protein
MMLLIAPVMTLVSDLFGCAEATIVVAEVEMEAGMKWSGTKWSVVEDTLRFGAGGVGGKDKLIEDMTYCW